MGESARNAPVLIGGASGASVVYTHRLRPTHSPAGQAGRSPGVSARFSGPGQARDPGPRLRIGYEASGGVLCSASLNPEVKLPV